MFFLEIVLVAGAVIATLAVLRSARKHGFTLRPDATGGIEVVPKEMSQMSK